MVLTLINNTSANLISGTFSNVPDGTIVTIKSNNFQASYEDGDGNPDCIGGSPQDRWQATITGSGYATMADALIAAGNYTYAAYHAAFPNKIRTTSIGRLQNSVLNPNGGHTGGNISDTVVSTANTRWPGHIAAQKQNLNGGCPSLPCPGGGVPPAPGIVNGTLTPWNDLWNLPSTYGIPTAAQMIFHAYDDIQGCQPLLPITTMRKAWMPGLVRPAWILRKCYTRRLIRVAPMQPNGRKSMSLIFSILPPRIMTHTSPSVFPATLLVMRISCATPDPPSSEL